MGIGKDGYWNIRDILGYNAKYNIVLSDRGRGKTFGTKLFLMQQEGEFMCVYRQLPDMLLAMEDWTTDLVKSGQYNYENFRWEGTDQNGYCLLHNGIKKGWFRYITQVNHVKQESFPDTMNWVWWDEFIPMAYKKLPGIRSEGDAFRTIMKTIDHDTAHPRESKGLKPLRALLYANPWTWNNPVLSYFHINGLLGPGIHRAGPGVVWELLEPFEEKKKNRKMTTDEFLGNEVNRNMGFMQQNAFISKLPNNSVPIASVRIGEKFYWLYKAKQGQFTGHTWVIEKPKHGKIKSQYGDFFNIYGTLDGLKEDEICIDKSNYADYLKKLCYGGLVRFVNINDKFDFLNSINEI